MLVYQRVPSMGMDDPRWVKPEPAVQDLPRSIDHEIPFGKRLHDDGKIHHAIHG